MASKKIGGALASIIRESIQAQISELVGRSIMEQLSTLGDDSGENIPDVHAVIPAARNATSRKARKDGRTRAKVEYVAIPPKMTAKARETRKATVKALFPTARATWDAISGAKDGITAAEIEASTGMPNKTVQSCAFFLRHAGLVKSVPRSE